MITAGKYGPWAIIAGGSEGIGAQWAHRISQAGINLVLIARKAERLEKFAAEVRAATGVEVRTLAIDLMRPDVLERMREVTDGLEIGLLVFNAAATILKTFLDSTQDEMMRAVRMCCVNQTIVVHHYAQVLAKRGRGGILLLGSIAGNAGTPNIATYCGAKAYTQMLAEALYSELKPHGIDVMILILGATDSPARRRSGTPDADGFPVLTPESVVQYGVEQMGVGTPVAIPPGLQHIFDRLSSSNRQQAVDMRVNAVPLPPSNHKRTD